MIEGLTGILRIHPIYDVTAGAFLVAVGLWWIMVIVVQREEARSNEVKLPWDDEE